VADVVEVVLVLVLLWEAEPVEAGVVMVVGVETVPEVVLREEVVVPVIDELEPALEPRVVSVADGVRLEPKNAEDAAVVELPAEVEIPALEPPAEPVIPSRVKVPDQAWYEMLLEVNTRK